AVATVLVWGAESVFEYLKNWLWRKLAQTVQHELSIDAYAHLQRQDLGWFADKRRGELMSVLNDDINQLERFLDGGANDLIQVTTTALVVGATFFVASPSVAVLAILPVPIILLGSFRFQTRIAPRYARVRNQAGLLNALLQDSLAGLETIRSFAAEQREVDRARAASDAYRSANADAIRLSAAFSPLIRMAIVVGFTATLLLGGWYALEGTMAVGTYSVLVFLTQRLLWPLTRLGATFDLYQRAMASTIRVLDLLGVEATVTEGDTALPAAGAAGAIGFSDIRFAYPGRGLAVDGVDLSIPAGRTVALVGATGSGKTTLVRLLLRFHDPMEGSVTLDGIDVRQLKLAELRRSVALVSQHVFLFPGTVAENIRYGRPEATDAEVEEAARQAEAHPFIMTLPQGYDTVVGEEGQKLSGGQRQRLSIARALLKDAPVLVLDEATSAVDNETEAAIQRSLARLAGSRTTLVIAHRLSTITHADEIIVLSDGRIAERGSHQELVARGGLYAGLWAVQTGAA
ncbi:MAG: ABC transporter ATP-binding protein, partial [Myxococcota bacterium]|nr:ABC transporter ATP-binding protein [Myxococcota bacterium]